MHNVHVDLPPVAASLLVKLVPKCHDYAACEDGSIWSKRPDRWGTKRGWRKLTPTPDRKGYLMVKVVGHTMKVHRVMLETFVGLRPAGMVCRHLDGNNTNNKLGNICWGTPTENKMDSIIHGTHATMETHGKVKLNREQVQGMRAAYSLGGTSYKKLGIQFGISTSTTKQIIRRQIWKMV